LPLSTFKVLELGVCSINYILFAFDKQTSASICLHELCPLHFTKPFLCSAVYTCTNCTEPNKICIHLSVASVVIVRPIKQQLENTADMADTVENTTEEVAAVIEETETVQETSYTNEEDTASEDTESAPVAAEESEEVSEETTDSDSSNEDKASEETFESEVFEDEPAPVYITAE
jgi:hypothetical protein